jgi:hypothetical protein
MESEQIALRRVGELDGLNLHLEAALQNAQAKVQDVTHAMEVQKAELGEGRKWASNMQAEGVMTLQRDLQKVIACSQAKRRL